jgi:hypothetical protein
VRYRQLRDVLKRPAADPEINTARQNLQHSHNIQSLEATQWEDGSWGAFHSKNTKLKQKIPTTEVGVARAIALGLDTSHPVLKKAAHYLLSLMQGEKPFPDRYEKNNRWPIGMRLFLASTLSLIQPEHPMLDQDRELWQAITAKAFQSGHYREEDEIQAHAQRTGATIKNSYLVLSGKYQLYLLGSIPGRLSPQLENALLAWLWEKPEGIGYLSIPLNREPPTKASHLDHWLASLELLARCFPAWVGFAAPAIDWLWQQQGPQGYWDFGPRPDSVANLPLSDNWRKKKHRQFDWTTRVLTLLRKFYDQINQLPGSIGNRSPKLTPDRKEKHDNS